MKKAIAIAIAAMFAAGSVMAQQPVQQQENTEQHHHQHDGKHHQHDGKHHHDGHHRHPGGPHGQQGPQKPAELQYNADGIETTLAAAFPEAKSIKQDRLWTIVYDGKQKVIGYGIYSKPASDSIRGFAGETPVLITLDVKKIITGVYALPNVETPRFQQRVVEAGFFNNWNGLSIKQAKKKTVDTVSGATFTSRAVAQSVMAVLEKL